MRDFTEQVGNVFEVGNAISGVVGKHWKLPTGLDQNVRILKRKREELNCQKEDTKSRIKAEQHPRKKVKKEVSLWLENIQRVDDEIENLVSEATQLSNLGLRGFLTNNVSKKIEEVEELLEKGRFSDGLVVDDPSRIGQLLPTPSFVGETMSLKSNEVLEHVMNNEGLKIGIHGMSGVGKTSLSKHVNNELIKDANKFNIVVWVNVSRNCSVIALQSKIAKAVNVVIPEDEDETIRAGVLSEMLHQKGRYALILDDVWESFSLEEVGIPEPTTGNGSKLVLTTQSLDVCHRMDCRVITIGRLPQADAWTLFLNKVGQGLMSSAEIEPVARSVAERCGGLPLAIITVASSMRGEYNIQIWRNTLEELNRNIQTINGDAMGVVFQQLRFSYDRLNDPKLRKCFLTCALYENVVIDKEQLIRDWIGNELIDDMGSLQANLDRGQAVIRKLVDNCLLENVDDETVKMHDLVRDMAKRLNQELFNRAIGARSW